MLKCKILISEQESLDELNIYKEKFKDFNCDKKNYVRINKQIKTSNIEIIICCIEFDFYILLLQRFYNMNLKSSRLLFDSLIRFFTIYPIQMNRTYQFSKDNIHINIIFSNYSFKGKGTLWCTGVNMYELQGNACLNNLDILTPNLLYSLSVRHDYFKNDLDIDILKAKDEYDEKELKKLLLKVMVLRRARILKKSSTSIVNFNNKNMILYIVD